jgi:hypothetical protein
MGRQKAGLIDMPSSDSRNGGTFTSHFAERKSQITLNRDELIIIPRPSLPNGQ